MGINTMENIQSEAELGQLQFSLFKKFFVPSSVLFTLVFTLTLWIYAQGEMSKIQTRERALLNLSAVALTSDFSTVISDLRYLRHSLSLKRYINQTDFWAIRDIKEEMLTFARSKIYYDQISYIDSSGQEMIRVHQRENTVIIVPDELLLNNKDRDYFINTKDLKEDDTYISELDLNAERDTVELPMQPTIRFATPVFDDLGQKHGLLIVNYRASKVLEQAQEKLNSSIGEFHLLNSDGYWLIAPDSKLDWGFILQHGRSFASTYPAIWKQIQKPDQEIISVKDSSYLYKTVFPSKQVDTLLQEGKKSLRDKEEFQHFKWLLVTKIPSGLFASIPKSITKTALILYLIFMTMLAMISWIMSKVRTAETISEYKLSITEGKLAHQTEILHTTLESIDQGIAVWSSDGSLLLWNERCLDLWKGLDVSLGMSKSTLKEYLNEMLIVVKGSHQDSSQTFSEGNTLEQKYQLKDGRFIELHNFPMPDGSVASVFSDITERIHHESELIAAKINAEDANRSKSVFLANMSHELRTPLNAILGFSKMMQRNQHIPKNEQEHINIINRSGTHLLQLINDILDMSKIEAGQLKLDLEDFDLDELVRDVTNMMRMQAEKKGLQLIIDQSPCFPRFIYGDETKLRQILINLLSNSIKFTQSGSITLWLDAEEYKNGALVLYIKVKDTGTGTGIEPEDIERIFQPFEQLAKSVTQKGTGLGLTISRQFVEMMQGEIGVESTLGKGSVFHFKVLVERARRKVVIKSVTEQRQVIGLQPGQPEYRILIVEDQPDNQLLLRDLLEQVGFHVRIANNGKEAIEQFQKWQPNFIWMDQRMPVMDGLTATLKIRELPGGREVKIVALTASVFKEQVNEMIANSDDYVSKPYQPEEIFHCMARHLGVRFLYDKKETEDESAVPPLELTESMLVDLPKELLAELRIATVELDVEESIIVIKRIETIDPLVGKALHALVDTFDFNSLQQLLKDDRG